MHFRKKTVPPYHQGLVNFYSSGILPSIIVFPTFSDWIVPNLTSGSSFKLSPGHWVRWGADPRRQQEQTNLKNTVLTATKEKNC